jgi:hypothetical protein
MAEARTMVTAATVLGRCLCCHHLVVVVAHHCPLLSNFPLCAIVLALATLAIFLIPSLPLPLPSLLPLPLVARHPCHRRHHLAALTLFVTHSLHWPLSLLLPAAVVAAAITLIVTRPPPALPLPSFLPLTLSPLFLLATLITIAITLFVTSAFTHLPPLLLSCRCSGGEGRTIPIQHAIQLWLLPPLPPLPPSSSLPLPTARLAGRGWSNNARAFSAQQWACAKVAGLLSLCSRRHPPCLPTAMTAECQGRWLQHWQRGNKVNNVR